MSIRNFFLRPAACTKTTAKPGKDCRVNGRLDDLDHYVEDNRDLRSSKEGGRRCLNRQYTAVAYLLRRCLFQLSMHSIPLRPEFSA